MKQKIKNILSLFVLGLVLGVTGCSSRTTETCNFNEVVSCSLLNNPNDRQACLNEIENLEVCQLTSPNTNSSVLGAYTCAYQPYTQEAIDQGLSVTYEPEIGESVIYVDPQYYVLLQTNLYQQPNDEVDIALSIQSAINRATPNQTIAVCPGQYTESLLIQGLEKANITLTNIANGDRRLAEWTVIRPITGSAIEIRGDLGIKVRGFKLSGGVATRGGGISIRSLGYTDGLAESPSFSFENLVIERATAAFGGAVYLESQALVEFRQTVFSYNQAQDGAAIYSAGLVALPSQLRCFDCQFEFNESLGGAQTISVGGRDEVQLSNASHIRNQSVSSIGSLTEPVAIILRDEATLTATNTDWGVNQTENQGSDILYNQALVESAEPILEEALTEALGDAESVTTEQLQTATRFLLDSFLAQILGNPPPSPADYPADTSDILASVDLNEIIQQTFFNLLREQRDWLYDYAGTKNVECRQRGEEKSCVTF